MDRQAVVNNIAICIYHCNMYRVGQKSQSA